MKYTYKDTIKACYLGNFLQSSGSVFAIFFIPIRSLYGITYTQFAVLLTINFITQVVSDVLFSKPVEKYGFRRFAMGAPVLSCIGMLIFAAAPALFPNNPFVGFCIGMFVFAASAGLQELLLSPILDALPIPEEKKGKSMSMLHSCFAWGQIVSVLITTLFVYFMEKEYWQIITCFWAVVPLISVWLFAKVPLYEKVSGEQKMKVSELLKDRVFHLILLAIITGGSAEVVMAQWASAFIERGMNLPKILGDMIGVCGFSFMLAMGRTAYGIWGDRISIHKVMIGGAFLGTVSYMIAATSGNPYVGIAACIVTGLFVSLLWPGSVVVASKAFPKAGAAMFALISAGGDVGASAGSFVIGSVADMVTSKGVTNARWLAGLNTEQAGLRTGLLIAALFPAMCVVVNVILKKKMQNRDGNL
ncbi:MFS transporter [Lachnospiraceae bacterium EP-SM-12S-S03]|nr:MFS transporter [Lachnospiraceae bacterium EP-SM-12S-S03]